MAFSNGTFSLYTPGNPVVTGTVISTSWGNNTLSDIATGLTTCVLKDGSQTTTAVVPFAAGISAATGRFGNVAGSASNALSVADTSTTPGLIQSTDTGATAAFLTLDRSSTSPAISDTIFEVLYRGKNNLGSNIGYASSRTTLLNVTSGTEAAVYRIVAYISGSAMVVADFGPGLAVLNSGSLPNGGRINNAINAPAVYVEGTPLTAAPVTKNADFTVADTELFLINNKSGSACVVTLPTASAKTGRRIWFTNYQAQQVNSVATNVIPLSGGATGTAILTNTSGRWCGMVSNGADWVITDGVI